MKHRLLILGTLGEFEQLVNGIKFFQIEQFRLEQAKEVFSNRIIQTSGFPGHTLRNAFRSQQVLVRLHLVLPALV